MNRVNIIMATYNGARYVREQIDSIVKGSYNDFKLWIFDDGSTDDTILIVKDYENSYPDKVILRQNNRNKGVTLNFLDGVQYAAKINENQKQEQADLLLTEEEEPETIRDYYMFCDQDDIWMTDKICKTMMQMKKIEKKLGQDYPVAVFTDALVVDNDMKVLNRSFHKSNRLDTNKVDLPHILMENKLIGCTIMFNEPIRQLMIGNPVCARYHDWWVALIAAAFGHISYLPSVTLFYRQHGGNVVGNQSFHTYVRNRMIAIKEQKEVINKNALQAEEFYKIYEAALTPRQKKLVHCMAYLLKESWIKRRQLVLKFGFMKTGVVRNLGLLYIL